MPDVHAEFHRGCLGQWAARLTVSDHATTIAARMVAAVFITVVHRQQRIADREPCATVYTLHGDPQAKADLATHEGLAVLAYGHATVPRTHGALGSQDLRDIAAPCHWHARPPEEAGSCRWPTANR